jgi:hypothetical protein
MAEATAELPDSTRLLLQERGFPESLAREALSAGIPLQFIDNTLRAGVTLEQARERFLTFRSLGGIPPLSLEWTKVPTDRPPKIAPGPKGLRLADVERGAYGYVPDHWQNETDLPRGAFGPRQSSILASYTIYDKWEVWADSAAELYEDAIADRWASAQDISWSTIEPLPDHIEQSICQLMTHWSEDAVLGVEVISRWLEHISYGFHEVKLFLATQVFDLARHAETFRKRALVNGGGLGVQGPGRMHRAIFSAMKFTEMVTYLNVQRTSFFLTLLETCGLALARNEAERKIYAYVVQDLKRHLRYGLDHLKYYVQRLPQKRSTINAWLTRGEVLLESELRSGVPQNEALILLLDDRPAAGVRKLRELRRKQVEEYVERLREATVVRPLESVAMPLLRLAGLLEAGAG